MYDAPAAEKLIGINQGATHHVGQMGNNHFKVQTVLQKTKFAETIDPAALESGEATTVLKILHHLLFRASDKFLNYMERSGKLSREMMYLPDKKFYKALCLLLADLFAYRCEISLD